MADKEYAPWSRETSDGLITSAVDSHVRVDQNVVPALNVGTIDKDTGVWTGVQLSDTLFKGFTTHTVPNGASELFPVDETTSNINMTGFSDLFIAIKPTVAGSITISAVMGLGTNTLGGLTPLNAAAVLRIVGPSRNDQDDFQPVVTTNETLVDNVWNIFQIIERASNQKNMQFLLTNNSGGESTIEFAYLRMV